MRLSCPNCQTEYDVPDAALVGRTRKLRCVSCGTVWEAGPMGAPPDDVGPTAAELAYMQRPRVAPAAIEYGGGAAGDVAPERQPAYQQPEVSQDYGAPGGMGRSVDVQQRVDPAEARHQADRESFAALLEASRQSGVQIAELGGKNPDSPARGVANPWLISILVLLLVVGLVFMERDQIMAVWPPSIRLFAALGLK